MSAVSKNTNIGFFHEVFTKENTNQPVGFLLGVVHYIPQNKKQILHLNEIITKAFQSSKVYLTENIMVFNSEKITELHKTVSLIVTTEIDEYIIDNYSCEQHAITHKKFDDLMKKFVKETNSSISFDKSLIEDALAKSSNKEILNLEDFEMQKNAVCDIAHRKFSQKNLKKLDEHVLDLEIHTKMSDAWICGDEEIISTFPDSTYSGKEIMRVRNRQMTDSICFVAQKKLNQGETFFAFPGMQHLYPYKGEKGIIQRLEEHGYTVRRVKPFKDTIVLLNQQNASDGFSEPDKLEK
jgi:hypothetical protein